MSIAHPIRWAPPPLLTFEKYAELGLTPDSSYTPTTTGFYHLASEVPIAVDDFAPQYYDETDAVWYHVRTSDYSSRLTYGIFISDGTNFRVLNETLATRRVVLMRAGYSKPNPSPPVGRQTLYGKKCIVLESDERGFAWIVEEDLTRLCEDLFREVRERKEKGEPHPLIGKRLIDAIKEDAEDRMGWGIYKPLLRKLEYDV